MAPTSAPTPTTPPPRSITIGPDPRRLWDFFPLHRAAHPIEGETVRATIVGWPPGRMVRSVQRMTVGSGAGAAVGVLAAFRGWGAVALPAAFAVAWLLSQCVGSIQRRRLGNGRDRLTGVMASDRRVVVARNDRDAVQLLHELPASSLTWGRIDTIESFWLHRPVTGVTLGGPHGPGISLEMPGQNRVTLALILQEAGIAVAHESEEG